VSDASSPGSRWDVPALRAGAGVCVVIAVPLQVLALLAGGDSPWSLPLRLTALVGFLIGAGVAAWVQRTGFPLAHGLVTAIAAFVAVQIAFIVGRAIAGNPLRVGAFLANLPLVVGVGLLGGLLGQALQRRGIAPSTHRRG
jgi:hypothetical protein